jgi:AraC family transcriptional regulator
MLFLHDGLLSLNGRLFTFRRGGVFVIPPGARCRVQAVGEPEFVHCYFSFHPKDSGRDVYLVPIFTQFDDAECTVWERQFREYLNRMSQTRTAMNVLTWSLLWRIAQPLTVIDANPVLDIALKWIEDHIAEKFSIGEVAESVDISHNQLIRHFRDELGIPPVEYVRQRRAELARGMLTRTAKPIKQIAHDVGVPNLQAFNRLIRECLGMAPRQVRRARMELDYFRAREGEGN